MKIAKQNNNNNKNTIIAIALAAVILIAIVIMIIVLLPNKGDKNNPDGGGAVTTTTTVKITGAVLETAPAKTLYYVGQEFDPTGLKIKVTTNKKSTNYFIDANDPDLTFSGFDSSKASEAVTVYATYKGQYVVAFDVSVEELPVVVEGTVTGISIVSTSTRTYDIGDALDIEGILLAISVEEKSEPYYVTAVYPGVEISGFDSSAVNDDLVVTVSYGGCSTSFNVMVMDKANTGIHVLGIYIVDKPQTTYYVGNVFNPTDLKIQVVTDIYETNYYIFADDPDISFSGFDSSAPAEDQVVTVTYKGFSATFTVDIKAKTEKPTLVSFEVLNLKNTYTMSRWNQNGLSISGATLKLTYSDNSTEEIPVTWNYVSALPKADAPGTITITITYSGIAVEVPITITE